MYRIHALLQVQGRMSMVTLVTCTGFMPTPRSRWEVKGYCTGFMPYSKVKVVKSHMYMIHGPLKDQDGRSKVTYT